MSDSVWPYRRQSNRLPCPGILQARTLEWVAISFSNVWKWSRSVVPDSSWPHGLQPTRLLRPWDFPGKSTGVECHHLLRIEPLGNTKRLFFKRNSNITQLFSRTESLTDSFIPESNLKHRWIQKVMKNNVSFYWTPSEETVKHELHYTKHGKISPQMLLSNSSLPGVSSPNLLPFLGVFMVFCLSAQFVYAKVPPAFSFLSSHSVPSLSWNSISMGRSFVILHGFFQFSSSPSILVSIAVHLSVKMWIFLPASE